ncbi:MAG TPA: ribosomal protein S18-alanine N-acetyltransferase [Vicinamibacterales bacterium]|nr:ribosomal protein S18-alanine N-acetyltransferase [Vicinamibacterales bacterium]
MSDGDRAQEPQPSWAEEVLPAGWRVETLDERDLDEVLAIERASFSNPWTRDMFVWELQNRDVSYGYVLRTPDGRVAAFCTVWIVQDELHINNIAVHPDQRGQGAGLAVLRFVLRLAAGLGARRATLEVRRSNMAARRLYERLGFRIAGVRRNYYSDPAEDALILWRDGLVAGLEVRPDTA